MNFIRGFLGDSREFWQQMSSQFRTNQVCDHENVYLSQFLRNYERKRMNKIIIPDYQTYKQIRINDYGLIFFLISQEEKELIRQMLGKDKMKQKILEDDNNPNNLFPLTFCILNNVNEMSELLLSYGADINKRHKDGNTMLHVCANYNKVCNPI